MNRSRSSSPRPISRCDMTRIVSHRAVGLLNWPSLGRPRRYIATTTRTSTALLSRGGSAPYSVTSTSRQAQGISSTKPRGRCHTFWNAGNEPCRILAIISLAGFERFYVEPVDLGGVAMAGPTSSGNSASRSRYSAPLPAAEARYCNPLMPGTKKYSPPLTVTTRRNGPKKNGGLPGTVSLCGPSVSCAPTRTS